MYFFFCLIVVNFKPKSDADINDKDNLIATYAWNEREKALEHCSKDKNCGGVVHYGKRQMRFADTAHVVYTYRLKFLWIFCPQMTLTQIPICGFFVHNFQIGVKGSSNRVLKK